MKPGLDRDWKLSFKIVFALASVVFAVWFVIKLAPVIALFLVAFLVVYFISPLMDWLISKNIPPFLAAVCTFSIIIIGLGFLSYLLIPVFLAETRSLANYLSRDFIPDATVILHELEAIDQKFNLQLTAYIHDLLMENMEDLPRYIQELLSRLGDISLMFVSSLWSFLVLIFVIFYLLIDMKKVKEKFTSLFPQVYHMEVGHVLSVIDEKVGAYVRGTIARCILVGIFTGVILYFIDMPFASFWGILAGILNIIVYIGPIIAAVPAVLLGVLPGTPHFLLITGIYVAVQCLDSFVLTPLLLGKAVDLSPLTVIAAVLIGAHLAGLLGILLAIPVAAIFKVLLNHYYINNHHTSGNN